MSVQSSLNLTWKYSRVVCMEIRSRRDRLSTIHFIKISLESTCQLARRGGPNHLPLSFTLPTILSSIPSTHNLSLSSLPTLLGVNSKEERTPVD
jgi:hypothetical protein